MADGTDSGRSRVIADLRSELFGPEAGSEPKRLGSPLSLATMPSFSERKLAYGPFHDADSGEEILGRDRPTKRYGIGVLYPREQILHDVNEDSDSVSPELEIQTDTVDRSTEPSGLEEPYGYDTSDDDFDLTATSQYRPSAMAVSFLATIEQGDQVVVRVTGGRYEAINVLIEGADREWFVRRPVEFTATFSSPERPGKLSFSDAALSDPLALSVELLARRHPSGWLCTVALVNGAPSSASSETRSLFQASFTIEVLRQEQQVTVFLPYPDAHSDKLLERDEEARSLDLLYRNAPTFGVGHGCAATWNEGWGELQSSAIFASALPLFEAPSITPNVSLPDGTALSVPMGPLAGLDSDVDGFDSIWAVANAYSDWIDSLEIQAEDLTGFRKQAAVAHIGLCRRAAARISEGIRWIEDTPHARTAFVLANRAVLLQQLHFTANQRKTRLTKGGIVVERGDAVLDWRIADRRWRAFQIGFLVATARSSVSETDIDRETVELIFFPTGGGKTEAYLGLSAFCLFYERLTGRRTGVSVLMRYTLRLLTSQQFLRASALICAMETIRDQHPELGEQRFSIGIWVGGSTTPNTRAGAVSAFNALSKGNGDNPFLVLRCPWCAAQMGAIEAERGVPKSMPRLAGYREVGGTIEFRCPDRACYFHRGLPVYVIDDDVYAKQPSIVIGTVDKFAMLAFRPEARALFGLQLDGSRSVDPPNLIIQDELHLIAGPLGSMVGIYEPIIEQLCIRHNDGAPIRPKIIGSTATIRNYSEQIKGLYGRETTALFPPHGLDASDSFFAKHARDESTGELAQGRVYVGVHAPGLGSIQTAQVRTGAALLQAAIDLPDDQRDPWWTSLMFFNSLRELGTSVSLLQADIPDYLYAMKLRNGTDTQRYVNILKELTSRLRQDEIPEAIQQLERKSSSGRAIDVCLASNIIEVGVDIPRLSLLTVLGQPKSTSQYIQITGRVGRNWEERPGLVVTIYSASRPRDRSHFEKFQSYHQRLYAEVEPVSVTPFSPPVLARAAHAAAIVHIRQNEPANLGPWPMPNARFTEAEGVLIQRAEVADPEAVPDVKRQLERRRTQWLGWEPDTWEAKTGSDDGPLLRRAGEWVPDELRDVTWQTPMSMRDVDAECRCAITNRYAVARGEDDEATE